MLQLAFASTVVNQQCAFYNHSEVFKRDGSRINQ